MKQRLNLTYLKPEYVRQIADAFSDGGPYLIGRGANPLHPLDSVSEDVVPLPRQGVTSDTPAKKPIPATAK